MLLFKKVYRVINSNPCTIYKKIKNVILTPFRGPPKGGYHIKDVTGPLLKNTYLFDVRGIILKVNQL